VDMDGELPVLWPPGRPRRSRVADATQAVLDQLGNTPALGVLAGVRASPLLVADRLRARHAHKMRFEMDMQGRASAAEKVDVDALRAGRVFQRPLYAREHAAECLGSRNVVWAPGTRTPAPGRSSASSARPTHCAYARASPRTHHLPRHSLPSELKLIGQVSSARPWSAKDGVGPESPAP
jgi:hypothetical protein